MGYKELREFMVEVFKDEGRNILDESLRSTGIVDIDTTSEKKKKEFADYILKEHLNFSSQKNRYLYEQLLKTIGLQSATSLEQYRQTVKEMKKSDSDIVLASIMAFWENVEKAYYKYGILINIFWLKGIEAELNGANSEKVEDIIKRAIDSIKKNIKDAYKQLIEDLYLTKYFKKKKEIAPKVFDIIDIEENNEPADEKTLALIDVLQKLKNDIFACFTGFETLILQSLRELTAKAQMPTEEYISNLRKEITVNWEELGRKYKIKLEKIEKVFA
ncbi:MAG: hypothetical protein QXK37_02335 [Candidatus Woesearchaeota archaeon]